MAVGGAVAGSAIGGLLGGGLGTLLGGGDIPNANYVKPTVSGSVGYGLENLDKDQAKTQEQFTAESTAPLQSGNAIQSQISQAGSPEMSAALKAKAGKSYSADINRLYRQQQLASFDEKQKREKEAYALGFRKKSIDQNVEAYEQAAKAQAEAYEQEVESARNSAIAAVLGGAGMLAGVGTAQGWFKGSTKTGMEGTGGSIGMRAPMGKAE